jgi:hypothetical protein
VTLTLDGLLLVRATIGMSGLRAGEHAMVDPEEQFVRDALAGQVLVPAEAAPADWGCLRCGESDFRTASGQLTCAACADGPPLE